MASILQADVFVSSVQFSDTSIELTFLENREQSEDVAIMRSMMLSLEKNTRLQEAFMDLQEILVGITDEGYFSLRNDGSSGTIREQMIQRRLNAEAEAGADSEPEPEEPEPERKKIVRGLL